MFNLIALFRLFLMTAIIIAMANIMTMVINNEITMAEMYDGNCKPLQTK